MSTARLPIPGPILGDYPQIEPATFRDWVVWERRVSYWKQCLFFGFRRKFQSVSIELNHQTRENLVQIDQTIAQTKRLVRRDGLSLEAIKTLLLASAKALREEYQLVPHPQQFEAAIAMLQGQLVQMATGEGKTIAVYLAATSAALAGIPVHVISANPYLAQRDQEVYARAHLRLGLSTAVIKQEVPRSTRATAYRCSIVYAPASELVFDYLHDQLAHRRGEVRVMRGLCFAFVDEADSVLLDEARTPFVIAGQRDDPQMRSAYKKIWNFARHLDIGTDLKDLGSNFGFELTPSGSAKFDQIAPDLPGVWRHSKKFRESLLDTALQARERLHKGRHYIVKNRQLEIVDSNTGRVAQGRRWSHGLHQFLELKEGLDCSPEQFTQAQLTYQRFFPRYCRLAGTSGTLVSDRGEFWQSYGLGAYVIPPRLAVQRRNEGFELFLTEQSQFDFVIEQIKQKTAQGRPVLIGTDSVKESKRLHQRVVASGMQAQLLNAEDHPEEAILVERAGQKSVVTISTNMAGRGTDIQISEECRRAGGLHVISLQATGSERTFLQLAGRTARQGDPGSVAEYWSMDTPLVRQLLGPLGIGNRFGLGKKMPNLLAKLIRRCLFLIEGARQKKQRVQLIRNDQDLERHLGFGGQSE